MLPAVWGNKTWHLLHILTTFPKRRHTYYPTFFYYIQFLLPCAKCRNSYKEHITALPIPRTKEAYTRWVIRVHNRVNQSIEKPIQKEEEMILEWREKYKSTNKLADIYFLEVAEYFLYDHPGYRSISEETIEAHLYFWNTITKLLPSSIKDRKVLEHVLEKYPLDKETIRSKTKYQSWFEKIRQDLPLAIHKSTSNVEIKCTNVCTV